jgi:hypothetical protein
MIIFISENYIRNSKKLEFVNNFFSFLKENGNLFFPSIKTIRYEGRSKEQD